MPVSLAHVPSYRKHAASGQARVTIDGRDFYLGFYNSAISRERYDRLIAEWIAAGRRLPCPTAELSVKALILAFMTFANGYYRTPAGEVAAEYDNYRVSLGPLRRLYGESNAGEFGPLALKAVREAMIGNGWARTSINRHISRVRRVFRWGAENELVPPNVHSALAAVDALRRGRSSAKESEPVRPVEDWVIEKTLRFLSPTIQAMVRLQRLTGMRPGEVASLTVAEIDRSAETWWYRPSQHKTLHLGHERSIPLGPRGRALLQPLLEAAGDGYVFRPTDSVAFKRERDAAARRTPFSCGNRAGSNQKQCPQRRPGDHYDVHAFRRAIARAAVLADRWEHGGKCVPMEVRIIPHWHPHQIRHTAATEPRAVHGIDRAGAMLGHRSLRATEIYAERNRKMLADIAEVAG